MDQKERNRIACKKYRDKNKEKTKARNKKFREENPDYGKKYMEKYCQENKEHLLAEKKKWRLNNLEKDAENSKKWRKNNPEKAHKSNLISNWKKAGIISKDWDATYSDYLNCQYCEWCDELFNPDIHNGKCLDHDHNINNEVNIRGVLCRDCNWNDYLGKFMQTLLN